MLKDLVLKDLILPITGTVGDANALEVAIALSAHAGAHLTVLEVVALPMPISGSWGMAPTSAMSRIYSDLRDQAELNAARLRARLEQASISSEVRVVESMASEPSNAAALHARYADLSVMTGPPGNADDAAVIHAYLGALVMESGRPVLMIPPRYPAQLPPRRAVVAWQPKREAARALHDAMPLLAHAEAIDVVVVEPGDGQTGNAGELPDIDIAAHLARHGLKVNMTVRQRPGNESVATALLRHAEEIDADLLVVGGYGHSRFREWVLGGTTRELLLAMHLPILFSH